MELLVPISYVVAAVLGTGTIALKDGVLTHGAKGEPLSPDLLAGLHRAKWAVTAAGLGPFTVTSLFDREGVEDAAPNTLHPKGRAADLRTRHLDAAGVDRMWKLLAEVLGPGFDVILESDHIHIEWDPRAANAKAAYLGVRE